MSPLTPAEESRYFSRPSRNRARRFLAARTHRFDSSRRPIIALPRAPPTFEDDKKRAAAFAELKNAVVTALTRPWPDGIASLGRHNSISKVETHIQTQRGNPFLFKFRNEHGLSVAEVACRVELRFSTLVEERRAGRAY